MYRPAIETRLLCETVLVMMESTEYMCCYGAHQYIRARVFIGPMLLESKHENL